MIDQGLMSWVEQQGGWVSHPYNLLLVDLNVLHCSDKLEIPLLFVHLKIQLYDFNQQRTELYMCSINNICIFILCNAIYCTCQYH